MLTLQIKSASSKIEPPVFQDLKDLYAWLEDHVLPSYEVNLGAEDFLRELKALDE